MFRAKDGNLVRFEEQTLVNQEPPNTFDRLLIAIIVSPGHAKSEAVHQVRRTRHSGEVRFYPAYERYADLVTRYDAGEGGSETGQALDALPGLDSTLAARLRQSRVTSIEALAQVPDSALGGLGMGARDARDLAQAYLRHQDQDGGRAEMAALRAELAALRAEMAGAQVAAVALEDLDEGAPALEPAETDTKPAPFKRRASA